MITSKQSKAARAFLNWSLEDLASQAGLSRTAVIKFENGTAETRQDNIKAIENAFSTANIEFIGSKGISEKQDTVELFSGDAFISKLWDNIKLTLGGTGGEILITNVDERRGLQYEQNNLYAYIEELQKLNITERLLSCEGDNLFIAPKEWYRWIPKQVFSMSTATFIYADKLAYILWDKGIAIVTHSKEASDSERKRFEYMWENAIIPPD